MAPIAEVMRQLEVKAELGAGDPARQELRYLLPVGTGAHEVGDPQNLKMQLRLNGELRQDANTSDMIYGVRDLVSWWSNITLEPGDVITSGAPAGVIAGSEKPVWLKPGDRIEASVEKLGTLVSTIASEPAG